MTAALAERSPEVLEADERSLAELADTANREYEATRTALASGVEHAIRCGAALLAAREQLRSAGRGAWSAWLRENFRGDDKTARYSMRLATYQSSLPPGSLTVNEALRSLEGLPPLDRGRERRKPDEVRELAVQLRSSGMRVGEVAEICGVAPVTVRHWCNPNYKKIAAANARRRRSRARAAREALEREEREQAIKCAVKKAGAATQEAWSMAERMQDVLAQAHGETEDRDARRALSKAGEHHRKMRDEIVRALGVA